jgi:hypothetical protein
LGFVIARAKFNNQCFEALSDMAQSNDLFLRQLSFYLIPGNCGRLWREGALQGWYDRTVKVNSLER